MRVGTIEATTGGEGGLSPSELFVRRPRGALEGRATEAEYKYQSEVKQFIANCLRPDITECLKQNESVLVQRYWVERHKTPEGKSLNMLCTHGLLRNQGILSATEVLCMLPIGEEIFEKLSGTSKGLNKQEEVEKILTQRLCGQDISYGGVPESYEEWTKDYVDFSPDQQVVVQVGGWTHSAIERHDDNIECAAGLVDNATKQALIEQIRQEIELRLPSKHSQYQNISREQVVEQLVKRRLGGNDLEKKVYVSLGTMGALGTDPSSVMRAEAKVEKDTGVAAAKVITAKDLNEKVTDQDVVMQPYYALTALENVALKRGSELGVSTKEGVMWKMLDVEGHSMGANVVARMIQTDPWKAKMELVGNDKYRIVLRNQVMWGTDLNPQELELAHEFLTDQQIRQHVALHRGLTGALVRYGPKLMDVPFIRQAAKVLPVVELVTDYYMGDLPPGTSKASHLETLENGRVQWELNNKWLAQMGLIVETPEELNSMRRLAGQGRLAMVNGVGQASDRILTAEAINLGAKWMGLRRILDSGDHVARPEYSYVWSLLWAGMLRSRRGGAETEMSQFIHGFVRNVNNVASRT